MIRRSYPAARRFDFITELRFFEEDTSPRLQSILFDGEQVEPTSVKPAAFAELRSSFRRLGTGVRIAHQGPMPIETASSMRPDTRRQSYLDAIG